MADYAIKLKAQQWRDDPYYVASSMPVVELEVVASTQREAGKAAQEVLGPPHAHHYWRIWVESMRDIRIPEPDEREEDR